MRGPLYDLSKPIFDNAMAVLGRGKFIWSNIWLNKWNNCSWIRMSGWFISSISHSHRRGIDLRTSCKEGNIQLCKEDFQWLWHECDWRREYMEWGWRIVYSTAPSPSSSQWYEDNEYKENCQLILSRWLVIQIDYCCISMVNSSDRRGLLINIRPPVEKDERDCRSYRRWWWC